MYCKRPRKEVAVFAAGAGLTVFSLINFFLLPVAAFFGIVISHEYHRIYSNCAFYAVATSMYLLTDKVQNILVFYLPSFSPKRSILIAVAVGLLLYQCFARGVVANLPVREFLAIILGLLAAAAITSGRFVYKHFINECLLIAGRSVTFAAGVRVRWSYPLEKIEKLQIGHPPGNRFRNAFRYPYALIIKGGKRLSVPMGLGDSYGFNTDGRYPPFTKGGIK